MYNFEIILRISKASSHDYNDKFDDVTITTILLPANQMNLVSTNLVRCKFSWSIVAIWNKITKANYSYKSETIQFNLFSLTYMSSLIEG